MAGGDAPEAGGGAPASGGGAPGERHAGERHAEERAGRGQDVPSKTPRALIFANLELRPDEYQAFVDGRRIALTVREFEVLAVLAEQADRVVRRPHIYARVWGGEMKHRDRAVDVFVRKIRNKLASAAPNWVYIHTHFGVGYRLTPEAIEPGACRARDAAE